MSVFYEILKCLLCCEEDYHERDGYQRERRYDEESPSYNTFVRSSPPRPTHYFPVSRFDPETITSVRDVNRANSSRIGSTRIGSLSNSSERSTIPYVPLRVPTTPHVPPRVPTTPHIQPRVPIVPVIPPRVVIDPRLRVDAESVSLSSFASYPPPSSSSSTYSAKPPPASSSSKQSASSPKPTPSVSKPSPSSSGPSSSSLKSALPLYKPTLAPDPAPSIFTNQQGKTNYNWVEKATSPIYVIPKDIEDLIKKDIVPRVLRKPLSPSTYKDYFGALLHAEDFYIEKWSDYLMKNMSLELQKASIYRRTDRNTFPSESDEKTFVTFEMDSVPERRPFLLSRDFVYLQPLDEKVEPLQNSLMGAHTCCYFIESLGTRSCIKLGIPGSSYTTAAVDHVPLDTITSVAQYDVYAKDYDDHPSSSTVQGVIYRVVKSNLVLVEFEEDFHSQHYPARKYNVSFSFNRFCLKRAHQAVEAASDPSFQSFLFPDFVHRNLSSPSSLSFNHKLDLKQTSAILRILNLSRPPPYLVEGPLSVLDVKRGVLSKTGSVVQEAIVHIIRTSPKSRILVCAPTNNTCDVLMRSLKKEISESDMFRANAAFRELDGVPVDVLPSCRYKDECFTCPSLKELKKFKVVLSTFVSSFRLHGEGITAGHFSHIFLVDASSTTEPETMVALANLANDNTAVVVTGAPKNRTSWIRSDIARQNGLRISYFERLRERKPYKSLDPMFISQLENTRRESVDTY